MIRGKNKVHVDYGAPDIYKHYCKVTGNPHKLIQSELTEITKEFYSRIMQLLIYDAFEYAFPRKLGNLRIVKYKNKIKLNPDGTLDKRRLRVDWKKTRHLWKELYPGLTDAELLNIPNKKKVYHENKHTDGYNLKLWWDKSTTYVTNYTAYSLKVSRTNLRDLAKALKREDVELNYYTYE